MRWVLVAGCGHTGTTITAKIIGLNSDVFWVETETGMFSSSRSHKLQGAIRSLKKKARNAGKPVICEKTPKHIYDIDFVRKTLRKPVFVLCARNPYDVIASLAARESDPIDKAGIKKGFKKYLSTNLALIRQMSHQDCILHRYEDFVEDPESSIRRICDLASLSFSQAMLDTEANVSRWRNVEGDASAGRLFGVGRAHTRRRSWQVNQKIFDNRGKWKTILDDRSKRQLSRLLDDPLSQWVMKKLGYGTEI